MLIGIAVVLSPGCKSEGSSCRFSDVINTCSDERTLLMCDTETNEWVATPCPGGCDKGNCDISVAGAGAPCREVYTSKDELASPYVWDQCRKDGKAIVGCRGKEIRHYPIRQPKGCVEPKNGQSRFNQRVARAKDPCTSSWVGDAYSKACSEDGTQRLKCDAKRRGGRIINAVGTWVVEGPCPNCRFDGDNRLCDEPAKK